MEIKHVRRERRRELTRRSFSQLGKAEWIIGGPLIVLAVAVMVALTVCPPLYALFGTAMPSLVNEAGDKGLAPMSERIEAWVIWVPWMAILGFFSWRSARVRIRTPRLAVDAQGVWPVFGGRIEAGLEWKQIAAVHVASEAAPPRVELFPVNAIKEARWPTLMDGLVVDSPPPAPGLRGKRYVFELADGVPVTEVARLADAVRRFGDGKLLTPRSGG